MGTLLSNSVACKPYANYEWEKVVKHLGVLATPTLRMRRAGGAFQLQTYGFSIGTYGDTNSAISPV